VTQLFFDHALLPDGWAKNVRIDVAPDGRIDRITTAASPTGAGVQGHIAVAGMPNLHSHAFQRAMAGLAETKGPLDNSFWTWRQTMYKFLEHLTPDDLLAIAGQLYIEMLETGFTSVAEFHYLHHDPAGMPYHDIGEMAAALARAATDSGMGITFLPVFYTNNGFGGEPPSDRQRRFITTPDSFARLHQRTVEISRTVPDARVGIAPHSLRALTPEGLTAILPLAGDGPVHIHIAEQRKEVTECQTWSGLRPVDWLLHQVGIDARWCLVHATHLTADERRRLAGSGAVAGLCPTTEADLGDGIFAAVPFLRDGGCFGIGSDSNVRVSVAEELRLLEYSQRLRDQGRNLLTETGSTGRSLFEHALTGGERAVGRRVGRLSAGYRADIVSLDADHPALMCRTGDDWLDGWIFAGDNRVVSDVWVGGRHVVRNGRHFGREPARRAYGNTLQRILNR